MNEGKIKQVIGRNTNVVFRQVNRLRIRHFFLFLILLAGISAAIRIYFTYACEPAFFWDTDSYLIYAREWLRQPGYFLSPKFRSFGYPLFLILTGGAKIDPWRVMRAQQVLGVAAIMALYVSVYLLTRKAKFAFAIGVIASTFPDLIFMELTIYSELPALFVAILVCCLFILIIFHSRRRMAITVIFSLLLCYLVFIRPVVQFALPVFFISFACGALMRIIRWRHWAVYTLIVLVCVGGYGGVGLWKHGRFRLVSNSYLNLLNWVGAPPMFTNLPPDMASIRRVFMELAAEKKIDLKNWKYENGTSLAWYDTIKPLAEVAYREGRSIDYDDVAKNVAIRAIRALPGVYLSIWTNVAWEYLTQCSTFYGLWKTHQPPLTPANSQVGPLRYHQAKELELFWTLSMGWITLPALILPWMLSLAGIVRRRRRLALLTLSLLLWCLFLGNTLVEPAQGQSRYRMPFQYIYLLTTSACVYFLFRWAVIHLKKVSFPVRATLARN